METTSWTSAGTTLESKKRPAFYVGDRVWIMKPKPVGGHNIQTYWTGPTTITSRTGASSFEDTTANGDTRAVHMSQIKPYQDDVLDGGAPLHFYRPGHREASIATPEIHKILSHRVEDTDFPHFLVHWSGSFPEQDSLLSLLELIEFDCDMWAPYCMVHGISTMNVGALWIFRTFGPVPFSCIFSEGMGSGPPLAVPSLHYSHFPPCCLSPKPLSLSPWL
jgi:hypothetical protein